jgi:DNA-binding CsgD family transcriptional regulator
MTLAPEKYSGEILNRVRWAFPRKMIGVLVGREAETGLVRTLLDEARHGHSKVLIFSGDAGIGKTAILNYARDLTDGLVLATSGLEGESDIPYVHLADLFRGVHSRFDQIPPRQAAALASVLAIGPPTAADRFAVAAAALSLLGALATSGPLTVLVDDAQWIDPASKEVLTFVAHRLGAEGIVLLFGVRSDYISTLRLGRFTIVPLTGLEEAPARTLVRSTTGGPMSEAAMSRIIAESGGNPLALIELPSLLSPAQFAIWSRGMDPLPIDSPLERAYCGTVSELPASTRDTLLLLAALGRASRPVLDQALADRELRLTDLDPAEEIGLIIQGGGTGPEFRHPLVRAAVFQCSTPAERRRAHLSAAAVLADSGLPNALEHRAWHLVAAGGMADEAVAGMLENAATEEFAADNFAVAGQLFERSAELTPPGGPIAERLARAAKSIRLTGGIAESYGLLRRAWELSDDPALSLELRHSLCRIEMWRSPAETGRDELLRLAAVVGEADPARAAAMLTDAALASVELGDLATARSASQRAMDLARGSASHPPLSVASVAAMAHGLCGEAAVVRRLLEPHAAEAEAIDPLATEAADQLALVISLAYLSIEQVDRARILLERAVTGARQRYAIGVLPYRVGRLAWVLFWEGRWSAARAAAHEALQLAEDTGWANERPSSLMTLARIEALTGRPEECRRHVAEATAAAEMIGGKPYVGYAQSSLGLLELTAGNYPAAIEAFRVLAELAEQTGIADTPVLWWSGDLIEAYVRCEMRDEAREVLQRLEKSVMSSEVPTAAAVAARSRALLEPEQFDSHIAEALRWHGQTRMPFERARTELLLGSTLRRRRMRANSRDWLRSALAAFERLGAVDWADRARSELQATGVRLAQPATGLAQLTPQELQVTLAVARGLSNREVATQLFLSVKTVEFHLAHVYDKLGVSRRTQLAVLVAHQESTA